MRFCGHCGTAFDTVPNAWKQAPRARAGERRLLTVIFCDMVGSTRLAARTEPEDLHAVVVAFREMCASAIQQLGGTVGQYLGDGLLAYFGYPRAREDDVRRALSAALRIQDSVAGLNQSLTEAGLLLPFPVAIRIGVHSGLIVVADLGRGRNAEAAAVVGETTNVAARLQSVAAVGTILVSDATVQLAGDRFELVDAGERSLDGVERPIRVHELRAERPQTARATDRALRHAATPFFDRVDQREALRKAWNAARRGNGAAFVLEGEPGMGKSRLVDEFRSTIGRAGLKATLLTCSPEDRSSSFHPVLTWVRGELGAAASLRSALAAAFAAAPNPDHETQLAVQLDCASDAERQALAHSPRQNRRNVVGAFLDFMTRRHARGTHLVIVEDLHWADEGTLAFVRALAARCGKGVKLVMLATTRQPLPGLAAATLKLERLPAPDALKLVRSVIPDDATDDLVDSIVQRTDGIPLFAEELARLSTASAGATGIPLTLRSTLSAQLDALGPAKGIAQAAAAFGQSFERDALEALVQDEEPGAVDAALKRLEAARLIELVPQPGGGTRWAFRHALMRDAAYDSVVRTRRRSLHGRIGKLLRGSFGGAVAGRPELVAQHFATANMAFDAAEQFEAAAARAASRLTHAEAVEHCRSGLEQLDKFADPQRSAELEIRLQILLASQITVTKGNADPEVQAAFDHARQVAERIGDERWLRRALRGLHTFHLVRGDIGEGFRISQRVMALSVRDDDPGQRIQVHRPHGLTLLYLGRFEEARRELLCAIALYDSDAHASHKFTYGSDPLVLARSHLGWAEWFLGDAARARRECAAAVEIARLIDHPHSLAFALAFQCCLAEFEDDAIAAQAHAAELVQLAERHEFAYWLAWGRILGGWAEAALGELAAGDATLLRGLAEYQSTGAGLLVPYAHLLRAELLEPESVTLRTRAHEIATTAQMGIWLHSRKRGPPIA